MELSEVLYQMMEQSQAASQPAGLCIGTVTSTKPLEISIDVSMAPLKEPVLYLTEAVIEKKITGLSHSHITSGLAHSHQINTLAHSHTYDSENTSTALAGVYNTKAGLEADAFGSNTELENIVCYENGSPLPVKDGYIVLNRGLEPGDEVLLLRVQNGQKFIVLSRTYKGGV